MAASIFASVIHFVQPFLQDDDVDADSLNVLQMQTTRGDTHNRPLRPEEYAKRIEFLKNGVKFVESLKVMVTRKI